MRTTITIRAGAGLRDRLTRRARAEGKTLSELVRDVLEREFVEEPMRLRIEHLRGRLRSPPRAEEAWRVRLRAHNWRS
jgi:hypothetical protein